MNIDGRDKRQLTFNDVDDSYPDLSPDGTKIMFVRGYDSIFMMNIDGTNPVHISTPSKTTRFPKLSPDGSKIVFINQNGLSRNELPG